MIEALQDILTTVSEHLLAAEEDISKLTGNLNVNVGALDDRLTTAEGNITTIQANNALLLDPYLTISLATINGLSGPHVILHDVNLHIRNGDDATDTINGLGNLLVGYNEKPPVLPDGSRYGSHNFIVGSQHRYNGYGGLVAGFWNIISGNYASVSGGYQNTAGDNYSSVSGGWDNMANGTVSSVSGGYQNTASGWASSISGGASNNTRGVGGQRVGGQIFDLDK